MALLAVASMFLLHLSKLTFVDPDLFHEMALAREAVELGYLPLAERFAYTPTIYPTVHHEWGTGMLLYGVTQLGGDAALMLLKYLLAFGCGALCLACARLRGASWELIALLAPLAIFCGVIGFTTVRAQVFTLCGIALLMVCLQLDSRGNRRWLLVWLPAYVLWVNLHAGFVVGLILLALHTAEQFCRRRPVAHLVAAGAAMLPLIAVNPYGIALYGYLARGLTLDRPLITEWWPLWQTEPAMFRIYLLTLTLVLLAVAKLGPRKMAGLVLLAVTAYAAARHTRHLSMYLVVWLCLAPGYLQQLELGRWLTVVWRCRARLVTAAAAVLAVVCLARALPAEPWRLRVPQHAADNDAGLPVYPVAAVDYLKRTGFRGNIMAPFVPGGYVSWHLHPGVKVSIDGRYEVAYQPGVLEENFAFYDAEPGWQATLERYPTDMVLLPTFSKLAAEFAAASGWQRVYGDEAYELFALPGSGL